MSQRGWELPPARGDRGGIGLWQSEGTTEAEPGSGHPCYAGTGETGLALGDSGPGPVVGVPTQAWPRRGSGKPPHHFPVPETHPSTGGGQKPGAGPGGPSRAVGWRGPAPAPQLGTEGEVRAGKLTGSKLAGHPQTAPARGPQPFPGRAEAAAHSPQGMLMWQTLLSPSHRAHAKGSRVSPAFGAGTQQATGTAVPRTRGHGAPAPQQPPSPPASPSITRSMGQQAPGGGSPPNTPTAVGRQIPEPALTSKIVQPSAAKAGGVAFRKPPPTTSPLGSWGGQDISLLPPPAQQDLQHHPALFAVGHAHTPQDFDPIHLCPPARLPCCPLAMGQWVGGPCVCRCLPWENQMVKGKKRKRPPGVPSDGVRT